MSSVVPCLGPGAPKSGFRIFPWLRGAFFLFCFLPPLKMKGSCGGKKMVERHSDPL